MQTDQFITAVSGTDGDPGHPVTPDDELRAFVNAMRIAKDLGPRIARRTKSPTQAACFALAAEQSHRNAGFAQILAADLLQRTMAHELPVEHFAHLRSMATDAGDYITGAQKLPDDPRTAPTGRPTFKNAVELLEKLLNISFLEARNRIKSVTHLLPHTDVNGINVPPRFPKLADELATGTASPQEVCNAANKLDSISPHITQQPDPLTLASELEQKVATSVHTENPVNTRQLLNGIKDALERQTTTPSEEVVRSRLGLFFRGLRSGVAEFDLRIRPGDADLIFSLCAQTDNPRAKSGDREGLLQQSKFGASVSAQSMAKPPTGSQSEPSATPKSGIGADPATECATELASDSSPESSTFPDFLLAASPSTGKPIATPAALAALTLGSGDQWYGEQRNDGQGNNAQPTATGPEEFPTERFENLNKTTMGEDGLTPPQRHLQGLLNLLKSSGRPTGKKTTGLPSPQMVIITTLAELEDRATSSGLTQHGQRLTAAELRQSLCHCQAIPIVMNGKSQILDLGRAERYFPDYMRQAILARDGGCIVPGCTVPPEHCEIHHLRPYSEGGPTRIEDGVPGCSNHHHGFHTGLYRIVRNPDGLPAVILPKFMDPGQKPQRNPYWNPSPAFTAPTLF